MIFNTVTFQFRETLEEKSGFFVSLSGVGVFAVGGLHMQQPDAALDGHDRVFGVYPRLGQEKNKIGQLQTSGEGGLRLDVPTSFAQEGTERKALEDRLVTDRWGFTVSDANFLSEFIREDFSNGCAMVHQTLKAMV